MRSWALLLAGLSIWATHFFALYAIGSILPGRPVPAAWLVIGATALAAAAEGFILWRTRDLGGNTDTVDGWIARLAGLGAGISFVAVLWQAAPAVLVTAATLSDLS